MPLGFIFCVPGCPRLSNGKKFFWLESMRYFLPQFREKIGDRFEVNPALGNIFGLGVFFELRREPGGIPFGAVDPVEAYPSAIRMVLSASPRAVGDGLVVNLPWPDKSFFPFPGWPG